MKHRLGSAPNVGFASDVEEGVRNLHCRHGPQILCQGIEVADHVASQIVGHLARYGHDVIQIQSLSD
jgi:hypothetical protein